MGAPEEANAHLSEPGLEDLPAYQRNAPKTEHLYTLDDGNPAKPWATLKLSSRAKSPNSMPLFVEGDSISGTLTLELTSNKHLKAIMLTLEGETLRVGEDPTVFYKESQSLWTPEMDIPNTDHVTTSRRNSRNKLHTGTYSWSFSMSLPKDICAPSVLHGPSHVFKAPPTLTYRASPAYIDYRLQVTFRRGAFRINQTLSATLSYVPRGSVLTPTSARFAAYTPGGRMLGPDEDPTGWHRLDSVILKATMFSIRETLIHCEFSIGSPLTYSINSPIPLWITMSSSDGQALELLMASKAVKAQLRRSLVVGLDAEDDDREIRTDTTFDETSATATIWSTTGPSSQSNRDQETQKITMEGEIFIPSQTKTSFIFSGVCLRYFVDFFVNEIPGFIFSGHLPKERISSQRVDIIYDPSYRRATSSRAPPGQSVEKGPNYDNSIGVLTAANQRFLHHGHELG